MEKVGDRIYNLRIEHNLSQGQLGEKVGVTRQTISLWEANRREPAEDKLQTLCEIFDVSPEYFVIEEDSVDEVYTSKNEIEIVGCTELEQGKHFDASHFETERHIKDRKKSIKVKILVAVIVVALCIGVIAVVIGKILSSPADGFGSASVVEYNFSPETVGWIIFVVALVVAAIGIGILIKIKRKNK